MSAALTENTMRKKFLPFGLTTLALISACDALPAKPPASEGSAVASTTTTMLPVLSASPYFTTASCPDSYRYTPPKRGMVFDYQVSPASSGTPSGVIMRQTVVAIAREKVVYSERLLIDGTSQIPSETYAVIAAVLPSEAPGRTLTYDDLNAESLNGLTSGQTVRYKMTEVLERGSSKQSHSAEVVLNLVGCGRTTEKVLGAPDEPVHVYRIVIPFASAGSGTSDIREIEMEWVVSDRLGWKVVERSANATSVLVAAQE